MTKIDIFSGFLGAGKTTLIKKLIAEAYSGEKLVLIENEFGEINIDGGFLKESGIEISEMSAGCICCSLVGDFNKALKEVVAQFHPDRILKNVGAQPGDVLVLTKPLGSGVLTTAIKAGLISPAARDAVYAHMATLNKKAGNAVRSAKNVHACTDVTGFGLLGHSYEMASGSGVTIRLHGATLPLMDEARDMAEMGIIPAGAYRNMDYVKPHLTVLPTAQQVFLDLAADPQTSSGLLIALPREDAEPLLRELQTFAPWSAIVGEVSELRATALEFD